MRKFIVPLLCCAETFDLTATARPPLENRRPRVRQGVYCAFRITRETSATHVPQQMNF